MLVAIIILSVISAIELWYIWRLRRTINYAIQILKKYKTAIVDDLKGVIDEF